MDVDEAPPKQPPPPTPTSEPVPEVEFYLRLLIIHHLLKETDTQEKALEVAQETVAKMQQLNRRTMDSIAAKIWYAVDRAYEAEETLSEARPYVVVVNWFSVSMLIQLYRLFLTAQKTASLRHDDEAQAALINCLLRNYLQDNLYDQADKLISKTNFPMSASNAHLARYHYYLGRIRAIQLNYTDAHTNLQQAIRRTPPAKTAAGFYQTIHKYFVIVELLMGDIPDRTLFRHAVLQKPLLGYFEIVKG